MHRQQHLHGQGLSEDGGTFKNWRGHFREGDFLLHFPGTFCGLSPSGVYTDSHLLECLHRVIVHFVAAV